jgi:hypothetical protein
VTDLDHFETANLAALSRAAGEPLPERSWITPEGRAWTPQQVLTGFRCRVSDYWAWHCLHQWVRQKLVEVEHESLPSALMSHSPEDPAWSHIENFLGKGEREPWTHPIGKADFQSTDKGRTTTVEFGTCAPAKFVLNLGWSRPRFTWMIVPYGCPYAFTFVNNTATQLISIPSLVIRNS